MAHGFAGTMRDFKSLLQSRTRAGELLSVQRVKTGGYQLSNVEQEIWTRDSNSLAKLFEETNIHNECLVLAEYDIPGHLGRCDLVILGRDSRNISHGLIIELKSWTDCSPIEMTNFVTVAGRTTVHPGVQVEQYLDCMKNFHAKAENYRWNGMVWMTRMNPRRCRELKGHTELPVNVVPVTSFPSEHLRDLNTRFLQGLPKNDREGFLDDAVVLKASFAKDLFDRLPVITRGVAEAIEHQPIDLTPNQCQIVHAILHRTSESGKRLILVSGEPGSGKTVVGLNVVIQQLVREFDGVSKISDVSVVMGLRNNRLCTVLRSAINDAAGRRISPLLVKYIKTGGPTGGLINEVPEFRDELRTMHPKYKIVVVDEAHRVPQDNQKNTRKTSQLDAVLALGETVVCLLDEGQCLNRDDNGTEKEILQTWKNLYPNAPVFDMRLAGQHRIPIGYADWLSQFLAGRCGRFPLDYEIHIADKPEAVLEYLRNKVKGGTEAGLLASYTGCNGRRGNDLRVPRLGIRWLMDPKDYNLWWRNSERRHKFDRCSSVYGCQGFELDYAGLFWGRDLALSFNGNNPEFHLSIPHDIEDDIGMAYGPKLKTLATNASEFKGKSLRPEVVEMLKNRYRILLSRARKGLTVFCEDPKTREALRRVVQTQAC